MYVVPWETYLKVTPKLFEITYQNVQIVCQVLSNKLGFSATTAVPIHMYVYVYTYTYVYYVIYCKLYKSSFPRTVESFCHVPNAFLPTS